MKRTFTASITHEGDWYVAQCLEIDLASQGETEEEALFNLREAIALHFTPSVAQGLTAGKERPCCAHRCGMLS